MNADLAIAALTTLCETLSGGLLVGGENLEWGYPDDTTTADVTVALTSISDLGRGEERMVYDPAIIPDGDTYVPPGGGSLGSVITSVSVDQAAVFTIKIECTREDTSAYTYASTLRGKLRLPTTRQTLRDNGLAFMGLGDVRDISYDFNGSRISAAAFELRVNTFSTASDAPVTTIETLETPAFTAG